MFEMKRVKNCSPASCGMYSGSVSRARGANNKARKTEKRGDKAATKKTKVIHYFISCEARDVDENVFQLS